MIEIESRELADIPVLHAYPVGQKDTPLPCVIFYHGFTSSSLVYSYFASLLLVLMLSACSALQGTPQPAPPVTDHPQEIRRDQTQGLQRIGSVSTMVRGSPDDALAEIRAKAVAAKADYYVVVMVDETIVTGQWYSQAILYRK